MHHTSSLACLCLSKRVMADGCGLKIHAHSRGCLKALKLLSCWHATMPYLSSAKACAITMGSITCPHVSTLTGFDHGHQPVPLPGKWACTVVCRDEMIMRGDKRDLFIYRVDKIDKIVGFHDATRLATLHNSAMPGPLTHTHPDTRHGVLVMMMIYLISISIV